MVEIIEIPVGSVVPSPFQPRETFEKQGLEELASSLKNLDMLQPIIVRPHGGSYQIACGERRWRAAQLAGWERVPVIVRKMDDRTLQLYSLVENLHRLDLLSHERETAVYGLWKEHYERQGKTKAQLSRDIGTSDSWVAELILSHEERAKILPPEIRKTTTTSDLRTTRGLDEDVREDLLKKKARGEIEQKELEDVASITKGAPREKQRIIVDEFTKEVKRSKEAIEVARQEAREYAEGREKIELALGADDRRLRRMIDGYGAVRMFTVSYLSMIENEAMRWKAVEVLERTRDHCNKVLRQLENQSWHRGKGER